MGLSFLSVLRCDCAVYVLAMSLADVYGLSVNELLTVDFAHVWTFNVVKLSTSLL